MTDQLKPAQGHGDYERRDIGVAGVLYFLLGLAVAGMFIYFIVQGVYGFLERRNESEQTAVSPLVTNTPKDTRKLPPEYKTDAESTDYEKYLEQNFPAPQLETKERIQLNDVRLKEERRLATYAYIDEKAGTVRIPIERAMDLIAQRGLPTRTQAAATDTQPKAQQEQTKASPKQKKK
ncbi:MAG TPA: hypothetical protein VMH04_23330 [Candidatus Solibacter sp.]|nr:hypothetical protein [Candidatus Solibacter sp.]